MKFQNRLSGLTEKEVPLTNAKAAVNILKTYWARRGSKLEEMQFRLDLQELLEKAEVDVEIELTPKQGTELADALKEHPFPSASPEAVKFGQDMGIL